MLGSKVIRFLPHRMSGASQVMAQIAAMIKNANPAFRYQSPKAEIEALLAGHVPDEIRIFVDDPTPKSGPQPDSHFIDEYRTDVFREVIVADVLQAVPFPNEIGLRFSDYVMIKPTDTGIVPISPTAPLLG